MKIYITDAFGNKRPASWYLPHTILEVLDTNSTRFLLHELTQMEAQFAEFQTQGISFPELCMVESIASGFDYVSYKQKLKDGQAQFMSRNATDFPKISMGMRPYTSAVIPVGVGFDVNLFEQQAAQRFGMSIDTEGLADCAEYIDKKLDESWHSGGTNPDGLVNKGIFDYMNGGADAEIAAGTSIYNTPLSVGAGGNTWAL